MVMMTITMLWLSSSLLWQRWWWWKTNKGQSRQSFPPDLTFSWLDYKTTEKLGRANLEDRDLDDSHYMQTKIGKNSAMQRRGEDEMFLEQTVGKLPPAFLWPISGRKQTLTPMEGCVNLKVKKTPSEKDVAPRLKLLERSLYLSNCIVFKFAKQVADKLKYRLWWIIPHICHERHEYTLVNYFGRCKFLQI